MEAPALELNLIKRYRPKYNILLKDDKHFPYLRTTPGGLPARRARPAVVERPREVLRPLQARPRCEVLDVVRKVFPIRTSERVIRPDRPTRPCVTTRSASAWAPARTSSRGRSTTTLIARVIEFLQGKFSRCSRRWREDGRGRRINHERAAVYRDRIQAVEAVMERQKQSRRTSSTRRDRGRAGGNGRGHQHAVRPLGPLIARALCAEAAARSSRRGPSVIYSAILRRGQHAAAGLILSAEPPEGRARKLLIEVHGRRTTFPPPMRGDKRKLVQMAEKNARRGRSRKSFPSRDRTVGAAEELQLALSASHIREIEGDISNTQGALSVGSVVMIDGVAAKKEYRTSASRPSRARTTSRR